MKTAVSIPDDVFKSADKLARRRKMSRSRLYAEALRAYLGAEHKAQLTEQLNAAYKDVDSSLDPIMRAVAARTFARTEW